jgi:4-diphosphocytidyl-2-C-methyl-D-erythritol kinase
LTLFARAPGKVNLSLFVGRPRADGLHPLVSVVQPVSLADELELAPLADESRADDLDPTSGGLRDRVVCPGVDGENLATRALREFRAATGWDGPPQTLTIVKRVPVAAGMGGGSADAAAALRLAAAAAGRPIPDGLAMRLGADVPAQVTPRRVLMAGAGERVHPLPGAQTNLVIVPLDAALSTADVYRAFDELGGGRDDAELAALEGRVKQGETPPRNDLELAARRLCPAIEPALQALANAGVEHPMVSGSGPTVFGVADDAERAAEAMRAAGYVRALAAVSVEEEFAAVRHNPQQ